MQYHFSNESEDPKSAAPPMGHGLLHTWTEDSGLFFFKSEPAGILKNGANIICTSLKDERFLFYAQVCISVTFK